MNRNNGTQNPAAVSPFAQNLRRVRDNRADAESRHNLKVASFVVDASPATPVSSQEQTSFDDSALEAAEPLCPNIRMVKRYLSHDQLVKAIPAHTDVLTITGLYKQVSPPEFKRPPEAEANFALLGVVATRSESKTSAQGNKYVTMTLSDLKYDISLALHGKALEKYWKVRPGTLIAVFNPSFYVQKAENVARNLALSCSKDACILEVGQAKDLGQCESMTAASKQSRRCRNWVDVRRSHYCEFHLEQKFSYSKRPEFNSATGKLWDPRNRANGKKLTVVQGGEVKWKRGLQFDTQANQGRFSSDFDRSKFTPFKGGLPDAPVGRVFQSTRSADDRKTNAKKYEEALGDRKKRLEREKWMLQRISEDNKITQRLSQSPAASQTPTPTMGGRVAKAAPASVPEKSQFGAAQLRKLGFMPKLRTRSATSLPPPPPATHHDSDSSDLEII